MCAVWNAPRNNIQVQDEHSARVVESNGESFLVNLHNRTCTCRKFQDEDVPCSHAVAFILRLQQAPLDYIPDTQNNYISSDVSAKSSYD